MIPPRRKKKKRQAPTPPEKDLVRSDKKHLKSSRWNSTNTDEKDNLFKLLQQVGLPSIHEILIGSA